MSSLAVKLNIGTRQLVSYFKSLGISYVLDSSFARLLTRRLYYDEFRSIHLPQQPPPSANGHSSKTTIFTGVCPGFVCYAEKTHGDLLVPLISRVRSPQAIMGRLMKDYLAKKLQLNPIDIFHVSVMPCYDKKLEASRPDFSTQNSSCREVDCVITACKMG